MSSSEGLAAKEDCACEACLAVTYVGNEDQRWKERADPTYCCQGRYSEAVHVTRVSQGCVEEPVLRRARSRKVEGGDWIFQFVKSASRLVAQAAFTTWTKKGHVLSLVSQPKLSSACTHWAVSWSVLCMHEESRNS